MPLCFKSHPWRDELRQLIAGPVPESVMVCGVGAFVRMLNRAVRAPACVGGKDRVDGAWAPAFSEEPHGWFVRRVTLHSCR